MGIVTGIGDKNNNINVITPQIDADLNKYILNKNAIIEGLQIVGNNLTAGMCVLCGYRGVSAQNETLNSETYIYGKFALNFNNSTTDSFEIFKTNTVPESGVNPTSITSAGTYYLLLYTYSNGEYILNSELNTSAYPAKSHEADETDLVKSGAVIESGVTGTTQTVNNNSTKIATTKYVQNQIAEEIAADGTTIDLQISYNNTNYKVATLTLERKAKYVIGSVQTFTIHENDTTAALILNNATYIARTIPKNGFNPKTDIFISIAHFGNITSATYARTAIYKIDTNGRITHIDDLSGVFDSRQYTFGYKTN